MTKEDFDAEVYEYAKSRNGTEDSRMTDRMLAYRAGAEPREKRIEALEAQIEKMKCCGNCKYSNQEGAYTIVCKVAGVDKTDYIEIDDNQVCDKWEIRR